MKLSEILDNSVKSNYLSRKGIRLVVTDQQCNAVEITTENKKRTILHSHWDASIGDDLVFKIIIK